MLAQAALFSGAGGQQAGHTSLPEAHSLKLTGGTQFSLQKET